MICALAFVGLALVGPPELPPDIGDVPPAEQPPQADPPREDPAPEPESPGEAPNEAPNEAPSETEDLEPPADPSAETEAIPVTPPATPEPEAPPVEEPPAAEPLPSVSEPQAPAPAVQAPSASPPSPAPAVPTSGPIQPEPQPVAEEPVLEDPVLEQPPEEEEEQSYRKLGGVRLFRIGLGARIGYTHGTSAKNGLYDRDKSIQSSIDNMMVTPTGAGDLGETSFGGFQYGAILDVELVGINVWLDFHKFFKPGGMWSLLLGYDHEFGFGKRLRLDVGVGGGLNHVFLGSALSELYYDKDNPEAVNIGTLGVEGRAMVDLHIKLVGPLYTGPYALLGYHYLWSANAAEVTAEKGLHYSAGWSVRLDFGAPKLIGGRAKK